VGGSQGYRSPADDAADAQADGAAEPTAFGFSNWLYQVRVRVRPRVNPNPNP
jgi:hypothetical protein